MTQNLNQFAFTPEAGMLVYGIRTPGLNAQIDPNSVELANSFIPGTPLKIVDSTAKQLIVDRCGVADQCIGFLANSSKKSARSAGDYVELVQSGNVMTMTASAAISAGEYVEIALGDKVAPSAGVNPIVGIALQQALADEDIIQIQIVAPLPLQVA